MGESSFRGDLFPPMRETSMFGGARGGRQGSQNSETPDAAGCRGPDPGTGTQKGAAQACLII
jgi:hypothetical protein